jgi:hypothetical protein
MHHEMKAASRRGSHNGLMTCFEEAMDGIEDFVGLPSVAGNNEDLVHNLHLSTGGKSFVFKELPW